MFAIASRSASQPVHAAGLTHGFDVDADAPAPAGGGKFTTALGIRTQEATSFVDGGDMAGVVTRVAARVDERLEHRAAVGGRPSVTTLNRAPPGFTKRSIVHRLSATSAAK